MAWSTVRNPGCGPRSPCRVDKSVHAKRGACDELPIVQKRKKSVWLSPRPALPRSSGEHVAPRTLPAPLLCAASPEHPTLGPRARHATPPMEDVLREYGPAMRRLCASYLPPGPPREDLEQDILFAIYRALPSFRHDASLRTFLYRIAHRCALKSRVQLAAHSAPQEDSAHLDLSCSLDPSPEHVAILKQRQERLAAALRGLPLSQRQPLTMRLNGLSYQEIADVLGLDLHNVTSRLHRGTAALKSLLQKEHLP